MSDLRCRGCGAPLTTTFVDLGMQPLSNAFVDPSRTNEPQTYYPLHVFVCDRCFLVQVPAFEAREQIFNDSYAYFSSYSDSWLRHAERYAADAVERFGLTSESRVVEVASNDGYLLRYFVDRGVRALGVEPSRDVAEVAIANGIPTEIAFFGAESGAALRGTFGAADLMAANNVLAHVPDLHDFIEGFARLLAPTGVASFEFPHLLRLIEGAQFDTIYQEHYSYLSLIALQPILAAHGLEAWRVEELPTHGGSLRLWFAHRGSRPIESSVDAVLRDERAARMGTIEGYAGFADRVTAIKRSAVSFLFDAAREGRSVAAYGAAAKGSTFLNTCGIGADSIRFVVDRNTVKQGRLMPGSRIPVSDPQRIYVERPDYIVILPWNIKDEIVEQLRGTAEWGARFVTFVPNVDVWPA